MAKKISTSALAKARGIPGKELFAQLESMAFIRRSDDSWQLLPAGELAGGAYRTHSQYGQYISWPEDLKLQQSPSGKATRSTGQHKDNTPEILLTATALGKRFDLSATRINAICSELGWIKKALKGWKLTSFGESLGGEQKEDKRSGIPYVTWPPAISSSRALRGTIKELQGATPSKITAIPAEINDNYRERFETKLRTTDGHYVRSAAEMQIDNWLYLAQIVHACERRLPIDEEIYCGFYLPAGRVYIEYQGDTAETREKQTEKRRVYQKYGFRLIELNAGDVQNLDEVLPRLLLKHGIEAF